MEHRLNEVEKSIIRLEERGERIFGSLDRIEASVSQWKWQLLAAALAVAVTVGTAVYGTSYSIQQMTVQTFQAGAAAAQPSPPREPPIIIYAQPPAATAPGQTPAASMPR